MKIVIFGAGSIGCYLGGRLLANGEDVSFIGRERMRESLQQNGMRLTDWHGYDHHIPSEKVDFHLSPEVMNQADVILVTVKGNATAEAAQSIAEHSDSSPLIISFQNGIYNSEKLKTALPKHTVLAGMVPFNVLNTDNCHFHCGTEGNLALEESNGAEAPFTDKLQAALLPTDTYSDMVAVQWGKLLLNLNNSVNALAGIPLLEELTQKEYRLVLAASISEALAVLESAGVKPRRMGKVIPSLIPTILRLPTWLFTRIARAMLKIDPTATSSMQDDLNNYRITEVDFLNGEIAKLGKQHNITTSVNNQIIKLIKDSELKKAGSPKISGAELMSHVGL